MGKSKIKAKEICTFYFHSEVLGTTRAMFLTLSSEVINVFVAMPNPCKLFILGPVLVVNNSHRLHYQENRGTHCSRVSIHGLDTDLIFILICNGRHKQKNSPKHIYVLLFIESAVNNFSRTPEKDSLFILIDNNCFPMF